MRLPDGTEKGFEDQKEHLGAHIRQLETERLPRRSESNPKSVIDVAEEEQEISVESGLGSSRKNRKVLPTSSIDDEVADFTEALERSDEKRFELEQKIFLLDRDIFESEKQERKRDREEG